MDEITKRKREKRSEEELRRKIRKLEEKLERRRSLTSKDDKKENESSPNNSECPKSVDQGTPHNSLVDTILDENTLSVQVEQEDTPPEIIDISMTEPSLDEETRKLLGEDPDEGRPKDISFHPDLVSRWNKMIREGLSKEVKADLLNKYSRKGNLSLEAPLLNLEISAILNESGKKRDSLFIQEQNFAGSALSAVGQALTRILSDDSEPVDRMKLVELLADSGKLLAQIHFQISSARKAYIAPTMTKQVKDLLQKTTPGDFLYGDKVGEVIKSAKSVEKLGKEISTQPPTIPPSTSRKVPFRQSNRSVNWHRPAQRTRTSGQGYRPHPTTPKFSKPQTKSRQPLAPKTHTSQQEKQ